jgi:hypothetical protein
VKVIAQYFPQLHRISENDAWWGPGFTDWVNVRRARPLFRGHYQPRVPAGRRYYDQSRIETLRQQVDLATRHGVHGFCIYHYWFDGKQLLEKPVELLLGARDLRIRFCLAWANESWSRRWDGLDHQILQEQTHPSDRARWELHFRYLIKVWSDDRALTVDGKPVFLIYRPARIPGVGALLDYFRERARAHGLPGVYFVAMALHPVPPPHVLSAFDALVFHQPFGAYYALREAARPGWRSLVARARALLPDRQIGAIEYALGQVRGPTRVDYDTIWREIVARAAAPPDPRVVTFPGAFVDWDNTARYGRRATVFEGATPARFEHWLAQLVPIAARRRPDERLLFVNAWNEWAEGAYLEPDERYGDGYLRGLARAVGWQGQPSTDSGIASAQRLR